MSEWRELELGRAITIKHGFAFKGEFFNETGGPHIVLTPGNFHDAGGFKNKSGKEKFYDGPVPDSFLLRAGDIVVAMTEQSLGLLGSTATIPHDDRYLHNQRIGLIDVHDRQLLTDRFVYHLLNTPSIRQQIQATATGSKVRHTAPKRISAIRALVPSVQTQAVIAEVLDSIDDLIENNRRRIAVLEEMVRAIYREWFTHFRYPGHEEVSFVDSPLGPIPEGWEVSTCGDELTILGGGTPSKKEPRYWSDAKVPWYTPSDLTKSRTRFAAPPELCINELGVSKSSAKRFPAGSVMMTSRATLGVLAIAQAEATTNQGFIVILPDERWPSSFVYEWLDAHAEELEAVATGATFKEITKGAFKMVPFLVPDGKVLGLFAEAVTPLDEQIRVLLREVHVMAQLRDLLLPKLVTGEIDVAGLDLGAVVGTST